MVETILKSSSFLVALINDVLDLSRLEDGSLQLDMGPFKLHALFREVLNLIKPIASVKKLSITLSLSSDLPEYAIGDEKRLMQDLLDILGNAVKFSKVAASPYLLLLQNQSILAILKPLIFSYTK